MKYAFMSFSTPGLRLDEMFEAAKRFGYDGIEPRMDSKHAHGVEADSSQTDREQIRSAFAKSGVALAAIASSCSYSDPAKRDEQVKNTHTRIDLAGDIGCPVIRVFGGNYPAETVTHEQAIDNVVEGLRAVGDHAAEREVLICMETHDAFCNPADLVTIMQRVDHPAIRVNWDFMHPDRTGYAKVPDSFEMLKPWIRHVHFHDGIQEEGKLSMVPVGEGTIDHKAAIQCLASMNYDGFMSGEWIGWEPWETHLPREIATMKRYEQELGL